MDYSTSSKEDTVVAAYFAGFFDGEGSVHVQSYKDRHGKTRSRLFARITQTDRTPLDVLVEILGCGSVHDNKDKRIVVNGWQTCYYVIFSDRAAREFLSWIEPYLIVKKEKVGRVLDEHGRDIEARSKGRKNNAMPS